MNNRPFVYSDNCIYFNITEESPFLVILFELSSAFGTVGLSFGFSNLLDRSSLL
ncbi:hypothetical protein FS935_05060 [Metabacillus litoralis]|uniref:Uncharacterized protein n=1 Tax=Metabacillus litoralis TaxID=152268 RepID=A0A5C6W6L6_9BACI|nr:hypothetical protein FS935_05060 [Metabacillus litoralis]